MAKVSKLIKFGYGVLDDLGMFSPTEKVIDILPQDKGTPEQIFSQIKQIGGKPVKEEMMFSGIEDAFSTSPKVTKEELQNYLSNNKTRVDEVIKSDKFAMEAGQLDTFNEFFPFSIKNIMSDGINKGERSVNDVLDGFFSEDDFYVKLFDDIANDPARTGTIDNPIIKQAKFEELSPQFERSIKDNYRKSIDALDDVGSNFTSKDDMFEKIFEVNTKNLVKFRFIDERDNSYTIRGNNNVGYEIATSTNTAPDHVDTAVIDKVGSFNEALVQINARRRRLAERLNVKQDLTPLHEKFTLPGGSNYQEIILKMDEPIDEVVATIGDFDDVVTKTDNAGYELKAYINLNAITGSPSETFLDDKMLKNLEAGKKVTLEVQNGEQTVKLNKDTNKIELLKKDYKNESHTGDEKNVVVFTRTKDRVDEQGRKILYAEEIQSDMSQQGRKRGLVMGQKEKKSFINTNNPIIYGDILDSINKLKETTNIADLKGVKGANIERGRNPISKQIVGFENDIDVAFLSKPNSENTTDFNKAHLFEDIVKKYQTKYKFATTKDNQIKLLANKGIDKSNIKLIDDNTLEEEGINISQNIYDDVSDYVDMSLFNQRIKAFRKSIANKIYDREYDRTFGDRDNVAYEIKEFNNKILEKLLTKDDYKQFVKDEKLESIDSIIPFYSDLDVKDYKKLLDTDMFPFNVGDSRDKISKAEFEKEYIMPDFDKKIAKKIDLLTAFKAGEKEKAMNFDYSSNAIDEVFEGVKELNANLDKAIKYDVKLQPISNIPSAPFIGSSERFTELAIKRLMKYANDNDYDGVSFSTGLIHDKRWGEPDLTQYYDVIIPKVAKKLLKGTDTQLEYKTIFSDANFKKQIDENSLVLPTEMYDINKILKDKIGEPQNGGFIKDTPTIYLTPQVKEYIDSGVSLYTPIIATGIAGTVANQILGSEEDIIENEGI